MKADLAWESGASLWERCCLRALPPPVTKVTCLNHSSQKVFRKHLLGSLPAAISPPLGPSHGSFASHLSARPQEGSRKVKRGQGEEDKENLKLIKAQDTPTSLEYQLWVPFPAEKSVSLVFK